MKIFFATIFVLSVSILLLTGCQRGQKRPVDLPELTPCIVSVTFGGEVMENVGVLLTPEDKQVNKWGAGGRTNSEGMAVMITSSGYEGVVPGKYIVSFKKSGTQIDMNEPPSLLPKKYAPGQSKETITVTTEQKEYVFELDGLNGLK